MGRRILTVTDPKYRSRFALPYLVEPLHQKFEARNFTSVGFLFQNSVIGQKLRHMYAEGIKAYDDRVQSCSFRLERSSSRYCKILSTFE